MSASACATRGCTKAVTQPLACPKCVKMGLPPSYFCSQQCFKSNYASHKSIHDLAKKILAAKAGVGGRNALSSDTVGDDDPGTVCDPTAAPALRTSLPSWARGDYRFTGDLRPCLLSPKRAVAPGVRRPDYADHGAGVSSSEQRDRTGNNSIRVYGREELEDEGLRHACAMGREVLDVGGRALRVGVTTDEIDRVVHEACMERECYPSPLNYYKFPKSVCTSVNEVICHGIPDYREVEDGDIVNVDVTVYNKRGFHGDLNETFMVGNVDDRGRELVETSFNCLKVALDMVKPGTLYRDLGTAIHNVAHKKKCSVVKTYCGHGIGSLFHTAPNVPHYRKNKAKGIMKAGHVFTVEPMINLGTSGDTTWGDNWTAVTSDGKRSAQFEHTVLVTKTGYDILTMRDNEPRMTWNPELLQR